MRQYSYDDVETTAAPPAVATPALISKVPEATATFWILKLMTTALGEAASDYLVSTLKVAGLLIGAVGFVLALTAQLRSRRYRPWPYWITVAMVAVFGTMAADVAHSVLGIPLMASTAIYAVAVVGTFWLWWRSEGTLSIHSITSRRREAFYWLAVSFTFALGTAAGDLTAHTLGLGFSGSIVLFAALIVFPVIGYRFFGLNGVAAFWCAYVLTRPLGASLADWAGKPQHAGALGYGDGPVALVLLGLMAAVLCATGITSRTSQVQPAAG